MRWTVVVCSSVLLIAGGAFFLATADSHHLNLRWILWKHHLWPYDEAIALRYLNVDVDFRKSLHGKTKSEILRFFPRLVSPDQPVNSMQAYYSNGMHDKDWRWIDDSNWAILFESGNVKDIEPIKG